MNHPNPIWRAMKLGVLTGAMLASASCEKKVVPPKTQQPVPVQLKSVTVSPVQRSVEVVGTLFGEEETVISAKVPGRIIGLFKDVGDLVAPGEVLVQLKPNDYQLAVAKAELAMKESLAKLGLSELPLANFDVTKTPTVNKARLQQDNAMQKFNRGKKLFESQPPLMSEQDFSDLETALNVAKSSYDVALLEAKSIIAEAQSRKGDLDIASQRLTDATTRAPSVPESTTQPTDNGQAQSKPHSYVVTQRLVNVGELVKEITPVYKLVDENPIKLRAMVPERYTSVVKTGQAVATRVDAYPNDKFMGKVSRINPAIDPANRSFSVEIVIPNDDHKLKSGAFARAAIETMIDQNVVFAPQEAVVSFAGVNKVFTVKDGKALEIPVELGDAMIQNNSFVEVAKGLKGQEKVVVSGTSKLAMGVAVEIKTGTTQSTTGTTTQSTTGPTTQPAMTTTKPMETPAK